MSDACDRSHNVTFFYALVGKAVSEAWTPRDAAVVGVGLAVCVVVVLANLLVVAAFLVNRRFHYPIYLLLGNMAAADLFAGVAYANLMLHTGPRTRTLSKRQWYVRGALIDISLTASVGSLLAVAVERHQTVTGMQLHSRMSRRRALLLAAAIWAVSVAMGLVPSTVWNCECRPDDCSTVAPLYSRRFLVFWAVLNLLTFLVMAAMYTRIFLYVRLRSGRRAAERGPEPAAHRAVVNLMKTISMVLGAFIVCWTPGLLTLLLDGLLGAASHANRYEKFCLVMAECNSLVNPVIYSLRDEEMRATFRSLLCCLCRGGAGRQGEPLSAELVPSAPGGEPTKETRRCAQESRYPSAESNDEGERQKRPEATPLRPNSPFRVTSPGHVV